jgi:hypothetical protein
MRTKTLLGAAILAAGLATSLAQSNVYSLNVVGYINVNLAAGFNLVANQLALNGAGSNNTVHAVFGTNLPSGSAVYAFSGGAFAAPPASYGTKGGWAGNTNAVNAALAPGGGVFIQTPSAATVTFVGDVSQGTPLNTPYALGFNIIASQVPQSGLIQTDLGYTPNSGDAVYRFTGGVGYQPTISYGTKGGWSPAQPSLNVGEAIFLQAAANGTWSRNFTIP